LEDVEYKKYAGVWCEIQITSILRHAWSEIEHEWYDLREAYPDEIKRRFYRLVGVFELVESEFIDLKKKRSDYQKSMDIQVEVEVPDVPVDVVSMKSLIGQNSLIAELDRAVSERLDLALSEDIVDSLVETVSKAAILAGLSTVNQVRTSLERYKNAILEYVGRAWELSATSRADPSTRSMRGISVFQLALLLIGARSEEGLREAMGKLLEVNTTAGGRMHKLIQTRAAIAREVLLKYAPPTDGSL
jgi:hypothetical protein